MEHVLALYQCCQLACERSKMEYSWTLSIEHTIWQMVRFFMAYKLLFLFQCIKIGPWWNCWTFIGRRVSNDIHYLTFVKNSLYSNGIHWFLSVYKRFFSLHQLQYHHSNHHFYEFYCILQCFSGTQTNKRTRKKMYKTRYISALTHTSTICMFILLNYVYFIVINCSIKCRLINRNSI